MIISIAIIEDESEQANHIRSYLSEMETESCSFNIACFDSAEEFLPVMKKNCYHLIFQDIQLKKMDGLSCARRIREIDENVIIVFITSMPQFAINGYEVDAKDYILKPIIYDAFERKIGRLLTMIQKAESVWINIAPSGNTPDLVKTDDILYVEVFDHKILYHLVNGCKEVYGTISNVEKKLTPYRFARCNRSTIVNFKYIQRIHNDTVTVADQEFSIGGTKKKEFMHRINQFINQ